LPSKNLFLFFKKGSSNLLAILLGCAGALVLIVLVGIVAYFKRGSLQSKKGDPINDKFEMEIPMGTPRANLSSNQTNFSSIDVE
jgi:hypothetical protein